MTPIVSVDSIVLLIKIVLKRGFQKSKVEFQPKRDQGQHQQEGVVMTPIVSVDSIVLLIKIVLKRGFQKSKVEFQPKRYQGQHQQDLTDAAKKHN